MLSTRNHLLLFNPPRRLQAHRSLWLSILRDDDGGKKAAVGPRESKDVDACYFSPFASRKKILCPVCRGLLMRGCRGRLGWELSIIVAVMKLYRVALSTAWLITETAGMGYDISWSLRLIYKACIWAVWNVAQIYAAISTQLWTGQLYPLELVNDGECFLTCLFCVYLFHTCVS